MMIFTTNKYKFLIWIYVYVIYLDLVVSFHLDSRKATDNVNRDNYKNDKSLIKRQINEVDPLFCDSVTKKEEDGTGNDLSDTEFVCVVSTDHVWNTEVMISITPLTVRTGNVDFPTVPTEKISALHIHQGTSLTCHKEFCEFELLGFSSVHIGGIIKGSKVTINSLGDIALDSSSATIDTSGRGYGPMKGPGAGLMLGKCGQQNHIGASHGGVGGSGNCQSPYLPTDLPPTYDVSAMDYGSGGGTSCGGGNPFGGGVIILVAGTFISMDVGSNILANASPDFCTTYCSGGSGGSIRLTAISIVGAGNIKANGGNAKVSGAGGRIMIIADEFKESSFLIQANAGTTSGTTDSNGDICTDAIGGTGSVTVQCKSSTCFNEGSLIGGGKCGCKCVSPWDGKDCTECTQTCQNGGIVDKSKCVCDCPNEWTGLTCASCNSDHLCNGSKGKCSITYMDGEDNNSNSNNDANDETVKFECSCDEHWFGSKCQNYCNRKITCSGNGLCSADGTKCICAEGKVGSNCFCDKEPDSSCLSTTACSGHGQCQNGQCFCGPGWVGCQCDVSCNSKSDCNGNGQCDPIDGACICKDGFTGPNCVQDPSFYCANPSKTKSGYPCVPGILNVLGHGYDALTGSLTSNAILQLTFSEGRTFTLAAGKTYELPDDVICTPKTDTTSTFSTREFRSTSDFRYFKALQVGLSAGYKAAFFSASEEYKDAIENSFMQDRVLFTSELNHGMYECSFKSSALIDMPLSSGAVLVHEKLKGNQRIQNLGTHLVRSTVLGGLVSVFHYVDICVFGKLSSNEVRADIEASIFKLVGSASASGSVNTYTGSSCSLYSKNSFFFKRVNGGDRSFLIVPNGGSNNGIQDLRDWFASLEQNPGYIRFQLDPIEYAFDDLKNDVETYIQTTTVVEYDQNKNTKDSTTTMNQTGVRADNPPIVCTANCAPPPRTTPTSSSSSLFTPTSMLTTLVPFILLLIIR